jgi:glycine cleavage system H lipoate-binding protein/ABC-type phosphate transport system substrate-binding protein
VLFNHEMTKNMKTRSILFIGLILLSCSTAIGKSSVTATDITRDGSINVLTTPDLYTLTRQWTGEYGRLNPAVKIDVTQASDNQIPGMLKTMHGIGFIADNSHSGMIHQQDWNIIVGRDVIVPVMNGKNPVLNEIYRRGINKDGLIRIFSNPGNQSWGALLGNGQSVPLHFYMTGNASITSAMMNFMHNDQQKIDGIEITSVQEMISAIQKDPNALGFCRMVDVIDLKNNSMVENVRLVPIDKNGNGKIDFMEDIYDNLQDFSRGVWIGKYPKALSGNIYSFAPIKPTNEAEMAFLKWVLTDGQKILVENGYSDLVAGEQQTQLDKINNSSIYLAAPEKDTYAVLKIVILVLVAFGVVGFILDVMSRQLRMKKRENRETASLSPAVFNEDSVIIPKGLYFDKTHTWAFMEKDGSVKIGIDDFLQHITGPLSRIGMKPAGVKIKKGDPLLTIIQKGKHLIIYSPVTGIITAYNKALITNSSALNESPYTDGWVYTVEPTNWLKEIQFLSMAEKYKEWLKSEFSRVKDFFASAVQSGTPEYEHIVMQDGGALKDSILAELGPEVWEDFQTKFIDNTR